MKILVYSHFFYPEVGAASIRIQYFVNSLKTAGHEVKVITPRPNYPDGKNYEGFNSFYKFDKDRNIIYLPIYIPRKHSLMGRGLSYITYFITSFFYALFTGFKYDIILTSSPPIITALAASVVSKIRRKKLIVDIRDLWPDIGIELGIIKNVFLIKLLKKIDSFILNNSDSIIVPLKNFEQIIKAKGTKCSVSTIFNGADTELFKPIQDDEKFEIRKSYNIPNDKKIAVYFGFFNFGMNDTEILAKSISMMEDTKLKYHFLFIGDGATREKFELSIKHKVNYTFLEPQNSDTLSKIIASCDLSIIPLKKINRNTGGFIPVKCLESWAVGLPVLLSTEKDIELNNIFSDSNGGKLIETGDEELLKSEIISLLEDPSLKEYGSSGRDYVARNFDRRVEAHKLINVIENF